MRGAIKREGRKKVIWNQAEWSEKWIITGEIVPMLTSGPPWFVLRERSHLIKLATRLLFNHNKKTLMEVKASRPIGIQQLWPLQADAVNSNCVFHHVSYGAYMWRQGNIVLIICNKCKRIEESGRLSMCPNSLRVIGCLRFTFPRHPVKSRSFWNKMLSAPSTSDTSTTWKRRTMARVGLKIKGTVGYVGNSV